MELPPSARRDVGAVGAVVLQHVPVLAALDGAVLPRGLRIGDDQLAVGPAPDHDRVLTAAAHALLAVVLPAQRHRRGLARYAGADPPGDVRALAPDDTADRHLLRLSPDLD